MSFGRSGNTLASLLRGAALGAALSLLIVGVGVGAAAAEEVAVAQGPSAREIEHRAQVERWKGRSCSPFGCRAPEPRAASHLAGFGLAVACAWWLARRSDPVAR